MYVQKLETLPPPPGVLGSLKAGFEAVSSHVILISLPFLLDVFLWLGPRMAVNELLGPVYAASFRQIQSTMGSTEQAQQMASLQGLFTEWLQNYNLVSLLPGCSPSRWGSPACWRKPCRWIRPSVSTGRAR